MVRPIKIKYKDDSSMRLSFVGGMDTSNWIDLAIQDKITISKFNSLVIDLGVAMELPKGYEAHIVPRSSTFRKYGILQTNSMGVIDSSYNGDGDWWSFEAFATKDITIEKGTRICQFRIMTIQEPLKFYEVELLGNKDRGGRGSTG